VASVLSDANGNWAVAVDLNNSTIQSRCINGWVNFAVYVFSSTRYGISEIPRRCTGGSWTDALEGMPATTPAPLSMTLADGEPGVRTLSGSASVTSTGVLLPSDGVATTQVVNTVVGEFHDVQDESGIFTYEGYATMTHDVAVSTDLSKWEISGSLHFSKSSSFIAGVYGSHKFGASTGVRVTVPIKWTLVKVEKMTMCGLSCLTFPTPPHYKWIAAEIAAGGVKVGTNISSLDHHCDDEHPAHMLSLDPNDSFGRHTSSSFKFEAGATLGYLGASISLHTQSGFDAKHGWTVNTGHKYVGYTYCGTDDSPGSASRVFFGGTHNGV
jgi:hypothetical protein